MQAPQKGRSLAWTFAALALVANVAGYMLDLYRQWYWFDRILHGFTVFTLTLWLGIFYLLAALRPLHARGPRGFLVILSVGIAVGAIWEVLEWWFDLLASTNVIKGKNDTIWDIMMDTVGAALAALLMQILISDEGQ